MTSTGGATAHFREALRGLKERGARLARTAPRLAHALAGPGLDPDVERLLEGLAALSGQVDARLDAAQPELVAAAAELYLPGFLRPVPACTIVQFRASRPVLVPRGTSVEALPIEGTRCRFRTAHPVLASPLTVAGARLERGPAGLALTLAFTQAAFAPGEEAPLGIFLAAPLATAATLRGWLLHALAEIEWLDGGGGGHGVAPEIGVQAVGFDRDQDLHLGEGQAHRLALLKEYFAFPERLLFFEIRGVAAAARRLGLMQGAFGLRFHLAPEVVKPLAVGAETFQLGATPAINLFLHTAEPLSAPPGASDFWLKAGPDPGRHRLQAVRSVVGLRKTGRVAYALLPEVGREPAAEGVVQVHPALRPAGPGTRLHLERRRWLAEEEVLSIELEASNGHLPAVLRPGDLRLGPEGTTCRELTRFSPYLSPPAGEDARRAVIAHLAVLAAPLSQKAALHQALTLYAFAAGVHGAAAEELALLLGAIQEVRSETMVRHHLGGWLPGQRTTVVFDEDAFGSEGELLLFGGVLAEVFAADTELNTVFEFELIARKAGRSWCWPLRLGAEVLRR